MRAANAGSSRWRSSPAACSGFEKMALTRASCGVGGCTPATMHEGRGTGTFPSRPLRPIPEDDAPRQIGYRAPPMSDWYLKDPAGAPTGPFATQAILQWIGAGQVGPAHGVCAVG